MLVQLPDFLETYDGVSYYNRDTLQVLPENEYLASSSLVRSKCIRTYREVKTDIILKYKPFKPTYAGIYTDTAHPELLTVEERVLPTPRTRAEQDQFVVDYKYALIRFVMDHGLALHHFNPKFKFNHSGSVWIFDVRDLNELDIYKYVLSRTDYSTEKIYVSGLLSANLVVPATRNNLWVMVSLKDMAAQFFKEYKEKIYNYLETRNTVVSNIYSFDPFAVGDEDDTVLQLWKYVFGTAQLSGKIEVTKIG